MPRHNGDRTQYRTLCSQANSGFSYPISESRLRISQLRLSTNRTYNARADDYRVFWRRPLEIRSSSRIGHSISWDGDRLGPFLCGRAKCSCQDAPSNKRLGTLHPPTHRRRSLGRFRNGTTPPPRPRPARHHTPRSFLADNRIGRCRRRSLPCQVFAGYEWRGDHRSGPFRFAVPNIPLHWPPRVESARSTSRLFRFEFPIHRRSMLLRYREHSLLLHSS